MASGLHHYGVLVHGKGPPPQPVGPVEPRGLKEPEHLVEVALDESRPSERGRVNSELVLCRGPRQWGWGAWGGRAVGAVAAKAQSWALGCLGGGVRTIQTGTSCAARKARMLRSSNSSHARSMRIVGAAAQSAWVRAPQTATLGQAGGYKSSRAHGHSSQLTHLRAHSPWTPHPSGTPRSSRARPRHTSPRGSRSRSGW